MDGRNRKKADGMSVEKHINEGLTFFYEIKEDAMAKAKEIRSYVYPLFEDIKSGSGYVLTHTGWGVPK